MNFFCLCVTWQLCSLQYHLPHLCIAVLTDKLLMLAFEKPMIFQKFLLPAYYDLNLVIASDHVFETF